MKTVVTLIAITSITASAPLFADGAQEQENRNCAVQITLDSTSENIPYFYKDTSVITFTVSNHNTGIVYGSIQLRKDSKPAWKDATVTGVACETPIIVNAVPNDFTPASINADASGYKIYSEEFLSGISAPYGNNTVTTAISAYPTQYIYH
ncbi:hypothetical protein L3V82_13155 [Thiotrichales bacterium 19S3-7]|nr:hypothetical protein [Thiotrichales bacterium 19S3-7]MCF6803117.1 hypothetical protein [Thiotrichales bacterium 19S3-11]